MSNDCKKTKRASVKSKGQGNRSSMKNSDMGLPMSERLFVTSCDTKRMKGVKSQRWV